MEPRRATKSDIYLVHTIKFLSFTPTPPPIKIYQTWLAASNGSQSWLQIRKTWGDFKNPPRLGHITDQWNQDFWGLTSIVLNFLGDIKVQARLKATSSWYTSTTHCGGFCNVPLHTSKWQNRTDIFVFSRKCSGAPCSLQATIVWPIFLLFLNNFKLFFNSIFF